MKSLADCRLYTFVDTAYLHGRKPAEVAQQLCDGGSDIIQLRAKNSSFEEIRKMAEEVTPICEKAGVWFVVNDHVEIASSVKSSFVHLGQEDFFDAGFTHVSQITTGRAKLLLRPNSSEARRAERVSSSNDKETRSARADDVGSQGEVGTSPYPYGELKIGLSTHAPAQAERAIAAGADYVAIGPIYATGTKPTAKPVTLEYVRWASKNVKLPWFAIGGINFQTIDDVLEAGATRICIVSAILNSPDIAKTCSEFKKKLGQGV